MILALDIINPVSRAVAVSKDIGVQALKAARPLRTHALFNVLLVATTAFSGAFVAGNDAGRAFNSFPKMGDEWIPSEILDMKPTWRNFFENTATVQFDHRMLALTTVSSVAVLLARAKMAAGGALWKVLPRYTQVAITGATHIALAQVLLGIATLLTYVPMELAVAHQVREMGKAPLLLLQLD